MWVRVKPAKPSSELPPNAKNQHQFCVFQKQRKRLEEPESEVLKSYQTKLVFFRERETAKWSVRE